MVPFGGWELPVQYEGIIAEYHATRRDVAVFDICHMGEFIVEGGAVGSGLDRIVTQRLSDLAVGACRYGAILNEDGGVIDDCIVFRLAPERWMLVVNGSTTVKDAIHIKKHLHDVRAFHDISAQTAKLDVQGPRSRDFLKQMIAGIEKLAYYTCAEFEWLGERVLVSRTGYTGELGYEIYLSWGRAAEAWDRLLEAGAHPAGLGARDVLRIEMGYSLYGHELTEGISPLVAGLNPFICWQKDFIGKGALMAEQVRGVHEKIVSFVSLSRKSPREGQCIVDAGGQEIGRVSSGSFSPSLARGIGLGFVDRRRAAEGDRIFFGADGARVEAEIVARPIYKNGTLKA